MAYNLVVTEHAEELLDKLVYYLIYQLKNEQAAKHLLDSIDSIYDRLEVNPRQFPISHDAYLAQKGYHEAIVSSMNYVVIFAIKSDSVNVIGIFHQSESYPKKI